MTFSLETYRSKGKWYWRVRSKRNGKIVADGAEGYASKSNLRRAVLRLPLNWRTVEWR